MTKLLIMQFLDHPVTFSLLNPYIAFSILFTNILNLCTTNNVRNHVSHPCTKRIHKISSVCKYCHCSAAVTMVRVEFVGPLGRHGRHLQTIEPRLRIVLCVCNVQENREARRI
jgi:hypothetical protein